MKYILYTTSHSQWYKQEALKAVHFISKAKGLGSLSVEVRHIKAPENPKTYIASDGNKKLDWEWFHKRFPPEDGVFFHFTSFYKKKWGLTVSGSKNTFNKDYPEAWFCTDKSQAKGYLFISDFVRLFVHEWAHFAEDLDNTIGDTLPQESVHRWDYTLKSIHLYPELVDMRGYLLKRKVNKLMSQVISLAQKVINNLRKNET